jgi:NADPH:quinone reductase-like Zn-dependent oxidoreductase
VKAQAGPAARDAVRTGNGGRTALPRPPQRMQAIVQDTYGDADVWHAGQIAVPEIAGNEVLIRVQAAGLDRGTWHLLAGQPYLMRLFSGLRKPKNQVPGLDVAGTVVKVGAEVTRFAAGDEVFGIGRGSFAEYAPARADKLARKPASLTFGQAVAVSGLTALQGLRDAGHLRPGQHVLITGASGGVGTFAVQIAKALGAQATGVCSTPKTGLVATIGADHVLDYLRDDFADGAQRYDLVLDLAGNAPLSGLRRALTPAGTLVIAGGEDAGRWTGLSRQLRALALSPFVRQRLTMLVSKQRCADIEHLAQLIDAGQLTPVIGTTYPLRQAADAMRHLAAGRARGKIVISVNHLEPDDSDLPAIETR